MSLMSVLCGLVCSSSLSHSILHRRLWGRTMAGLRRQDPLRSRALRRPLTWGCHHLSTGAPCRRCILQQDCSRGVLPHHHPVPTGQVWGCQCTGRVTTGRHPRGTCSISRCPLNLRLRWRRHHKVGSSSSRVRRHQAWQHSYRHRQCHVQERLRGPVPAAQEGQHRSHRQRLLHRAFQRSVRPALELQLHR